MEKFRVFTDKATGINPFTPVKGLDRISVLRGILGTFLLIGTLPLVIVIELFCLGYESLYTFASACHIQAGVKVLLGWIPMILSKLYLILMHHSFWNGKFTVYPLRRKVTGGTAVDDADEPVIQGGTVLVCNLQSPIDVLVIQYMCCFTPLFFCMPCDDDDDDDAVSGEASADKKNKTPGLWWSAFRQPTFLRILAKSAMPKKLPKEIDIRAIQMLGRRLGRPVVLFAEGTPTNGKSVLQVPGTIVADPLCGDVLPVGISYQNASAVNSTIPQALLAFLVRLVGASALSGGNKIDVSVGRPSLVKNLSQTGELIIEEAKDTVQDFKAQRAHIRGEALQKIMADTASYERVSGAPCRTVESSCEQKRKFIEMWDEHGKLVS